MLAKNLRQFMVKQAFLGFGKRKEEADTTSAKGKGY